MKKKINDKKDIMQKTLELNDKIALGWKDLRMLLDTSNEDEIKEMEKYLNSVSDELNRVSRELKRYCEKDRNVKKENKNLALFEIGDRVYSEEYGYGVVINKNGYHTNPMCVDFGHDVCSYTEDGRYFHFDFSPCVYNICKVK
ncbi:hypothetical protein [Clostridium sp.]|uniref:hypothetical protein n=1 Tax=Clostridium sp. TaxID=1506 RepID=UPI003F677F95